ncbi:MAG: DMT family transporter [Kangiellaceae bacterium]
MNNFSLFISAALIWGSTWIMITFQLGEVEPLVSVIYRFTLASAVLFIFSYFRNKQFHFSRFEHFMIFIQGVLLFGFNYWLTYLGITKINSSLAAILSTSILYFNVVFARIILKDKINRNVLVGGAIGFAGILIIFLPETQIDNMTSLNNNIISGVLLVLFASIFASLGNIVSSKTQRMKLPIIQTNALGMGYAAVLLSVIASLSGLNFSFEYSVGYISSLIYLSIFGSVLAFGAFLTLLGRIGPDKAGYISLIYPVIALIFSTVFEDYQWSLWGVIGVFIILFGNAVAMGKLGELKQKLKAFRVS